MSRILVQTEELATQIRDALNTSRDVGTSPAGQLGADFAGSGGSEARGSGVRSSGVRSSGEALAVPEGAAAAEVAVWDIDSGEPPPAAEMVITARPAYPAWFPRIEEVEGLQHIHLLSLGYEWVLPHLSGDMTLSNSRGAVEDATAEFTLALILAALRRIPDEVTKQHQKVWERGHYTSTLANSRVLVLGYGGVGSEVVRRIEPFRPASISIMAGRSRSEDGYQIHGSAALSELLPTADVVIMTLPHTSATEGYVDAEFLRQLPDGALVVNVGRGKLVNHTDLIAELRTGRLRAALDVVDPEPLPETSPLWETPNLLMASHVAGNTTEFLRLSAQIATEHVLAWVAGEQLPNQIHR